MPIPGWMTGGNIASGWLMQNAGQPANMREQDSETPWLTDAGIDFIAPAATAPWLCHLSYIKPHWPYIVPAPYNTLYGPHDVMPANRDRVRAGGSRTRSMPPS